MVSCSAFHYLVDIDIARRRNEDSLAAVNEGNGSIFIRRNSWPRSPSLDLMPGDTPIRQWGPRRIMLAVNLGRPGAAADWGAVSSCGIIRK